MCKRICILDERPHLAWQCAQNSPIYIRATYGRDGRTRAGPETQTKITRRHNDTIYPLYLARPNRVCVYVCISVFQCSLSPFQFRFTFRSLGEYWYKNKPKYDKATRSFPPKQRSTRSIPFTQRTTGNRGLCRVYWHTKIPKYRTKKGELIMRRKKIVCY